MPHRGGLCHPSFDHHTAGTVELACFTLGDAHQINAALEMARMRDDPRVGDTQEAAGRDGCDLSGVEML